MPTYSIDGPDGKTYSIDGPEGATREQVIAKIKERQASEPSEKPSIAADVGKSFASGVGKGALAIPGVVGDVQAAASNYNPFDYLADKYREAYPEQAAKNAALAERTGRLSDIGAPKYPTTGQLRGQVEKVTGPFHEPQTEYGKAAETVGEFAASSPLGPGGKITKAVTTVTGGLGAYGGEKLGEQVDHPEAGRFIGGLAGGIGGGVAAAETVERRLRAALPGKAENYAASKKFFDAVEKSGVRIDPAATTQFIDNLDQKLQSAFITKAGVGAPIFAAIDKARDGNLAELIDLHSRLGKIRPNRGELYEAAVIARPEIREFIENLQQPQLLAGNAQLTAANWELGRDTWKAHAKLSEIEQASEAADVRRAATGRGMNWNTFRQEFKKILLSDDRSRGYSPEAIEKLEKIVKGSLLQNASRIGSAAAPQRGVLGAAPTAFGFLAGGVETAGAIALTGELSHFLEGYLTKRQIRQLEDLVKRESPLAPAQQPPNWQGIAPAASARSALAAGADSPLRVTVPVPYGEPAQQ